jgi:BNR repeat-like domain
LLTAFSAPEISTIISDTHYNTNPAIVYDPLGRIQVYYRRGTDNGTGLNEQRAVSTNNGATWTITTVTPPSAGSGFVPQNQAMCLTRAGRIYWTLSMANASGNPTQESWIQHSDDYGETWSGWVKVPDSNFDLSSTHSVTAMELIEGKSGELLLQMQGWLTSLDTHTSSVLYRSYDGGVTWTTSTIASAPSARNYNETRLCYIAGTLVAWVRDENGGGTNGKLWRTTSSDDGLTWTTPVDVTPPNYMRSYPDVVIVNGITQITYRGNTGGGNTMRAVSYDYGVTWSSSEVLHSTCYEYSRTIVTGNTLLTALCYSNVAGTSGTIAQCVLRTARYGPSANLDGTGLSRR